MKIKQIIRKKLNQILGIKEQVEKYQSWHEDFIVHLAKIIKPKVYVELGLYQCKLFNRIVPFADQLIGVEMKPELEKFMIKDPKALFKAMTTDEYAKELKKHPIQIDMMFIDADHSEKSVEKDFKQFFPFIAPHGLILLHDGHPKNEEYTCSGYCGDGYKAIEKLSHHTDHYEMMTIPVHPGLTICRKRKKQLKWEEI